MDPIYVCPVHSLRLLEAAGRAVCPNCTEAYPIEDGIWLLDRHRRPDREAFNEQASAASPREVDRSRAADVLAAINANQLAGAVILDVGCGFGDLTAGLADSDRVSRCEIYAFDHALSALHVAKSMAKPRNGNQVSFSVQDASAIFFPENRFDLVAGFAVLHHFTDWRRFMASVFRIVKPGGTAFFAEPFLDGYLWACVLLRIAVADLNLGASEDPRLGMCRFILNDISYRLQNGDNPDLLNTLVDKHLFRKHAFDRAAREAGFASVEYQDIPATTKAPDWMRDFLQVYGISHPELCNRANQLYDELASFAGPALREVTTYFQNMVLRKSQ